MKKANYLLVLIIAVLTSCKKPYLPPAIAAPGSYLVVEGVINNGPDSTFIKLSKTVNLSSNGTKSPVTHADLTIESDQNNSYSLTEISNGNYFIVGLNLDNARKYRLRIKTADDEYVSDFVSVENSPPIDSVNFTVQGNGVNIYSNTHDPKNNTRYYRWDFQETWVFFSNYESFYKSNGDTVLPRDLINDNVYQCWKSDTSSSIILGSSAKLVKDVIANNPLTFIGSTSEKLGSKYSINVRQYALSGDAYNFWGNLKKNTEQLGSIFDAQPSQIKGNIHSVNNASEPVIGYISAGSVSTVRIFISSQQLPNWRTDQAYTNCAIDTFLYKYTPPHSTMVINQVNEFLNYNKGGSRQFLPLEPFGPPFAPPIGYTATYDVCADCTIRGTNKQPAFWK